MILGDLYNELYTIQTYTIQDNIKTVERNQVWGELV